MARLAVWTTLTAAFAAILIAGCAGWDTGKITVEGPFGTALVWDLPELPATNTVITGPIEMPR